MPAGGNWKDMFNAASSGDTELLSYHIRMGVDINYQHPEYLTSVLIECIRLNQLGTAKTLLENGADIYAQEGVGRDTAVDIAQRQLNIEALKLLNEYLQPEDQMAINEWEAIAQRKNTPKNWWQKLFG